MKTAEDYNWESEEAVKFLDTQTDKQLIKRLGIIRSQQARIYELSQKSPYGLVNGKDSNLIAQSLFNHEEAVIQARMRKLG